MGKNFHNVFYLAIALVAVGSFGITLLYSLLPEFFIKMLFGEKYLGVAPFLGRFGIFMSFFALSFVSAQFFLAIRKLSIAPIIVAAAILQIILIYLWHDSLNTIITANLVSTVPLFTLLMLYFVKINHQGIDT